METVAGIAYIQNGGIQRQVRTGLPHSLRILSPSVDQYRRARHHTGDGAEQMPYMDLSRIGFVQLFAALPMLAFQLWLSLTLKNQGIAVGIGITASVVSMFALQFPDWMPLKWPPLAYMGPGEVKVIARVSLLGAVITCVGLIHFNRKDVD